jgi:site-specific DNA-adenine methylase
MFQYYGSKKILSELYPPPKFAEIIEPFAGSAQYSLRYFDRDVMLIDKYDKIINVWKWLQKCTANDILKLPRFKKGEKLQDLKYLSNEERDYLGFIIRYAMVQPAKTVSQTALKNRPNRIAYLLNVAAESLFKIKHWNIICGDYRLAENRNATWFIDPPYQRGGHCYKWSNKHIDYGELATWCQTREGQIIVCENEGADWLPFRNFVKVRGIKSHKMELIYTREKFYYQQSLFYGV